MNERLSLSAEELEELKKCNRMMNYEQLEAVCRDIKQRRGGSYPIDWHAKVNQTRIIDDVRSLWGKR